MGDNEVRVREAIHKPSTIHIMTAAVWAGIIAVLQVISMLGFSISAVIVSLNVAVSLYAVSGLWFGVWGILGACVGMIIGNTIGGLPISIVLLFQLATIFEIAVPMIAFRWFGCDPRLRDLKSWVVWIISASIIASGISSIFSAWYVVLGQAAPEFWLYAILPGWFAGSAIGRAVLGGLALVVLTPFIQRFRGYVPNEKDRWIA
ncbi:hypothetical protein JR334_01480 [Clostridia bacterium]|nr:hypothetical protein JR334_01480 [Clostridia bacterium]